MQRGFTLIELILVIAILSILSVSAIPIFVDTSDDARGASRDGVVGAVKSGLMLYRANDLINGVGAPGGYPAALDAAANGACNSANQCFTTVLHQGVDDSRWIRISNTQYSYNDGRSVILYMYDSVDGSFEP